ncbi:hypothetical protein EYR01_23140 [Xanthomonas oryzae pv. oryzae]|nr:hypothetical protein EBA00_18165 [Xanthomonas oryzae pv. oryzae]TAP10788.1 hypothetical protein EYR04_04100 [Xanthomonas oryzae pv. oryzae]TAP15531.1 hypothetical protein EYR01_23140 [Xanthomonas oryzae pv. oryzae]
MARATLVFGNGLGMALDPTFFSLDNAIGRTWEDSVALDEPTKDLVRHCLSDDGDRLDSISKCNTLSAVRVCTCQKAINTSVRKSAQCSRSRRGAVKVCARFPGF